MDKLWGAITDAMPAMPSAEQSRTQVILREPTDQSTVGDIDTCGDIDAAAGSAIGSSNTANLDDLDEVRRRLEDIDEEVDRDIPEEDAPLIKDVKEKRIPFASNQSENPLSQSRTQITRSELPNAEMGDTQLPVILGRQKPPVQLSLGSPKVGFDDEAEAVATKKEAGTVTPGRRVDDGFTTIASVLSSVSSGEIPEKGRWCHLPKCSVAGFCHCLYIIFFLCFLVCFPLFLKWMISAPKPPEYWYEEYDKWPLLSDWDFVQKSRGSSYKLTMSDIPQTWGACNHTCSQWNGALRATSEMNFKVEVKLEAQQFKHTAYPVLLASNNFDQWWVAADRRHAAPRQYFASHSASAGNVFRHVTDKCTRPPQIFAGQPAPLDERFADAPTYVLVCITWKSKKAAWHRKNLTMAGADLGEYCDAIGGVCGWPCGSGTSNPDLPGCKDGILHVGSQTGSSHVAEVPLPNARLSGNVSVRACKLNPGSNECVTSAETMSQWPCHKCRNVSFITTTTEPPTTTGYVETTTKQMQEENLLYNSLPPLEVLLRDADMDKPLQDTISPQAFVFTSPLAADGKGPAGMTDGVWKKLYDPVYYPKPTPVDDEPPEAPDDLLWYEKWTTPLPSVETDRHNMHFSENSKVDIEPEWCYGRRGPLYLVACAVNASTYEDGFAFKAGQEVAPPPFNDRCLAVTGRCAFACMERQEPMLYCEDGEIPQTQLVGNTETKTNRVGTVYMFIWTLVFGFAVKVLSYLPGLFVPYSRAKYYSPEMTERLKYIAVCSPSASETKACVLRNLVGAMSSLPENCRCPFHVVFADEGHRHPHKIMFRAFVSVMQHVPDVLLTKYHPSRPRHGKKAENLRRFTKAWVESTKKMKLSECNTEDLVRKIRTLSPDSDEAKKLEEKIDALSGVTALKTLQGKHSWPSAKLAPEIRELEASIQLLRMELVVGEKMFASAPIERDFPKALYQDDCEAYGWRDPRYTSGNLLYHLHYVARAAPEEDERTLKVQHVARGIWCYKIPKMEEMRKKYNWLDLRMKADVFQIGDDVTQTNKFLVPLSTSRGKAGGLNFAENYLFDFTCRQQRKHDQEFGIDPEDGSDKYQHKYSLFSVAEARHQYQSDFFVETIPYFFTPDEELNPRVAFTTCPQYFDDMPDDADFLDTNNSNHFRLGCMLKNCCGGVTSRGTNATWLIRDRPYGSSMWELEAEKEMDLGFTQVVERRFFHESCKVEDEASSLDRIVKGKYSQYVHTRLSYGMAKEPTEYLAAVQRWVEGGVVMSLQTFFGKQQGVHMIWMAFLLFTLFVVSLFYMVYGENYGSLFLSPFLSLIVGDAFDKAVKEAARNMAESSIEWLTLEESALEDYQQMFYDVMMWLVGLVITVIGIWCLTVLSWILHTTTCCGRWDAHRRTRFPVTAAQWARLLVALDELIGFVWFWTAFFWVGFNFYSAFTMRDYFFNPHAMAVFAWSLLILNWSMLLCATTRDTSKDTRARNEVSGLSLTNIWRSTQLFYITAPLTVYAIMTGISDFLRYRMFNEDIALRQDAGRGKVSKVIVQLWTLMLVVGMFGSWISFWAGWLPDSNNAMAAVIVITFIGFDVLHPCTFLWLGTVQEKLPKQEEVSQEQLVAGGLSGQLLRFCNWILALLTSKAFYRNKIRAFVFSPKTTGIIKMLGPLQHVALPFLTIFIPHLGVQQVLMLLAAVK